MLLAVDVGNTQTVLGLYRDGELADHWRLATERSSTADELGVLLGGLLDFEGVDGICLASTVPVLVREWEALAANWAHAPLLVVGPGVKTGITIRYDDPREVGAVRATQHREEAARLVTVDYSPPQSVIGKTTVAGLQSGMVYGFAGQVDGIVGRIRGELAADAPVIATGGLADLVAPHSETIERVDPFLTLEGLRLVWALNP